MNLAQVGSFVFYSVLFTGISMLLAFIINEHDCGKLTEEIYFQTSVYKSTGTPYDQALTACFEFQNVLSIISKVSPLVGLGLGIFFIRYYRTKEVKT